MENRAPWTRNAFSRAAAAVTLSAALGCGSGPTTPSPPPTTTPSGPTALTLPSTYVLQVVPDPVCGAPFAAFSFAVDAARADTARAAGVEIVIRGEVPPTLEMELQSRPPQLRGGLGTIAGGARSLEGPYVEIQGMGLGTVTGDGRGQGEIVGATLMGELNFGFGECSSASHRWSLRRP